MNHDDEEREHTIKAYMIYKSMIEKGQLPADMDDMYNKYAMMNKHDEHGMHNEMFMKKIKKVMDLLENNVLSGVCPLTFDFYFGFKEKVCGVFTKYMSVLLFVYTVQRSLTVLAQGVIIGRSKTLVYFKMSVKLYTYLVKKLAK